MTRVIKRCHLGCIRQIADHVNSLLFRIFQKHQELPFGSGHAPRAVCGQLGVSRAWVPALEKRKDTVQLKLALRATHVPGIVIDFSFPLRKDAAPCPNPKQGKAEESRKSKVVNRSGFNKTNVPLVKNGNRLGSKKFDPNTSLPQFYGSRLSQINPQAKNRKKTVKTASMLLWADESLGKGALMGRQDKRADGSFSFLIKPVGKASRLRLRCRRMRHPIVTNPSGGLMPKPRCPPWQKIFVGCRFFAINAPNGQSTHLGFGECSLRYAWAGVGWH